MNKSSLAIEHIRRQAFRKYEEIDGSVYGKKKRKKIGKLRGKKHKDRSVKEMRRCVCTQARKSTRETL